MWLALCKGVMPRVGADFGGVLKLWVWRGCCKLVPGLLTVTTIAWHDRPELADQLDAAELFANGMLSVACVSQ